ncbi:MULTISPECIES: DLW-39 family protein [unclassified Arthrobacter]|nr:MULTISPECIES: DLW-39 family protein [unclassified Arthrobacter]MCC9144258.1 DLW-39 family protein [Arthrobacter sp. zg-Y919]MDK1275483.1 DLW-39 family protein [Arthrobacter sp. zg.Y919]WIB04613.1 DLW-39 family protein [Arthrobacter sp. zg-Y919]
MDHNGKENSVKKLLAVTAAAAAGIFAFKKWQETAAEKTVWKQSTDKVD